MGIRRLKVIAIVALCGFFSLLEAFWYPSLAQTPTPTPAPVSSPAPPSGPAPSSNQFTGLDVIFVVDQSGSMCGTPCGVPTWGTGRDPNGLRFQTMQVAMQWLGNYAHYAVPDSTIRMAVLNFGDPDQLKTLDWTLLSGRVDANGNLTKFTTSEWLQQEKDLDLLLSAARFGKRSMGETNFEDAFKAVWREFTAGTLAPLGPNERNLRVIFFITDGEPCKQDACGDVSNRQQQLTTMKTFGAANLPPPDYQVYLIVIEKSDGSIWRDYGAAWTQILGDPSHSYQIQTADEMGSAVLKIMSTLSSQISKTQMTYVVNPFNGSATIRVPPYVRQLRLNFFLLVPRQLTGTTYPLIAKITRPGTNQTPAARGDPDVLTSETTPSIETWSFDRPMLGDWQVVTDPAFNNKVQLQYDLVTFQHKQTGPTTVYQWQTFPIAPSFFFLDAQKNTQFLTIDPAYPLRVTALVNGPGGTVQTLALKDNSDPALPNVHYATTFTPVAAGTYTVELVGEVPNFTMPAGQVYTPLDTRNALGRDTLTVKPAEVVIDVDDDLKRLGGNWMRGDPANICLTVRGVDTKQKLANVDKLRVEAVLKQPSGKEVSAPLKVDASQKCSFAGTIAPSEPGRVEVLARGYLPKADGSVGEVEVFNQAVASYVMTVQDPRRVVLEISQPTSEDPNSNVLRQALFWLPVQPLSVRVEAKDENGVPVDIGAITGTGGVAEASPLTISILDSSGKTVLSDPAKHQLVKLNDSTYQFESTDFGPGTYLIRVDGKTPRRRECFCDYALKPDGTVASTIERPVTRWLLTGTILLQVLASLGVIALVATGGLLVRRWASNASNLPLSGTLVVYRMAEADDPDLDLAPTVKFNLKARFLWLHLNGRTLGRKELAARGLGVFRRMTIETTGTANRVKVTLYLADQKKQQPVPQTLTRGGPEREVYNDGTRYLIAFDPGAMEMDG